MTNPADRARVAEADIPVEKLNQWLGYLERAEERAGKLGLKFTDQGITLDEFRAVIRMALRAAAVREQSEADALDQALAELRSERHKTETWKEKERAALSKAIARIEKLKATKGTDVEK